MNSPQVPAPTSPMFNFSANHLFFLTRTDVRRVSDAGPRHSARLSTVRLHQSQLILPDKAYCVAGKVNSADKLYLVIESVRPDAKHTQSSNAPVPDDGAGARICAEAVSKEKLAPVVACRSGRRCRCVRRSRSRRCWRPSSPPEVAPLYPADNSHADPRRQALSPRPLQRRTRTRFSLQLAPPDEGRFTWLGASPGWTATCRRTT